MIDAKVELVIRVSDGLDTAVVIDDSRGIGSRENERRAFATGLKELAGMQYPAG